jgi:hypothetical protein
LSHRITTYSLSLRRVSFNNDAELQNWLDEFFTENPADFFKCRIEYLPKRWGAAFNNGGEYINIDFFIICMRNKLFVIVKETARTYAPI